MISGSYFTTASGLLVPIKNGFVNRIVKDQPGSGTLVLPAYAKIAKLVLLGAAGSGASMSCNNSANSAPASAGGGGPLISAVLDLDTVGRSLNYVLGAGGAAVLSSPGTYNAGFPGAVSSVVWGTRVFTANPGQGGQVGAGYSDQTVRAGGLGGAGTGGDFNFPGGPGGAFSARDGNLKGVFPGGGSSGRPNGDGFAGGQFAGTFNRTGHSCMPGGGWGFSGDVNQAEIGIGYDDAGWGGPGTVSRGQLNGIPGMGAQPFPGFSSSLTGGTILSSPGHSWWDINDIEGWGGAVLTSTSNGSYIPLKAGPGGGGCGGSRYPKDNQTNFRFPYGPDGGFGGGGGAGRTRADTSNNLGGTAYGGDGGPGGGGGAAIGFYLTSNGLPALSGKGGDAWLGVWFN